LSRDVGASKGDSRLPGWTRVAVLAGGLLAYVGVGVLLMAPHFRGDLDTFWHEPGAFTSAGIEHVAPYVLLLVPAVLGGIWTRDSLRVVFQGMARGDSPITIARDVALYALSFIVLILAGLFANSKAQDY
jgi:hypothetical protein